MAFRLIGWAGTFSYSLDETEHIPYSALLLPIEQGGC